MVEKYLEQNHFNEAVPGLYDPVSYILSLPAKRVRPVLFLMSHQLFRDHNEKIMPIAGALEWFHNFTLMHDDIMDESPLRRGKSSVHSLFGNSSAILSGDALLIHVYKQLCNHVPEDKLKSVLASFNDMAVKVCEGQQMDIEFELETEVNFNDYEQMIAYKTAVLLACSLKMGAILGDAGEADQEELYQFGLNLGLAFQIQDDYLDLYGDSTLVGKQKAGDIIQCKKNIAYIIALEKLSRSEKDEFIDLYLQRPDDPVHKLEHVYKIYESLRMEEAILERKNYYQDLAIQSLMNVKVEENRKSELLNLANQLLNRNN